MSLLFVCTGNICRSALAERLVARWTAGQVAVGSAGTHPVVGSEMHAVTAEWLVEHGGSSSGFRSRQLSAPLLADAELVLVMTAEHRRAVLAISPRHLRRTFTVLEAAELMGPDPAGHHATVDDLVRTLDARRARRGRPPAAEDVPDPIGMSGTEHRQVAHHLATGLWRVLGGLAPDGPPTRRTRRLPPVPARV